MTQSALVWITARDGSIHATCPPIVASGQPMLCALSYGRLDLRVRKPLRLGDPQAVGTCPLCSTAAAVLTGTPATVPQPIAILAPL